MLLSRSGSETPIREDVTSQKRSCQEVAVAWHRRLHR